MTDKKFSGLLSFEELYEAVSKSAREGVPSAQKLAWEMLKATDEPDQDADPFDALDGEDELSKRRKAA